MSKNLATTKSVLTYADIEKVDSKMTKNELSICQMHTRR